MQAGRKEVNTGGEIVFKHRANPVRESGFFGEGKFL